MSQPETGKRILLVEDEALIALDEASMLKRHGYEVSIVYGAEEALERVKQEPIDLILMDIDLGAGKMDGTEAAELILKDHVVPIVFLSSHTEAEIVKKTEKISSYGYIVKNSGEVVMNASIHMAFKLFESHSRLKQQKRRLDTTLNSIGDGVITCDGAGSVTSLNPVAETLTGWLHEAAVGKPVREVFNIVESTSRRAVINPVEMVLSHGKIEGLGNHTLLISTTGEEYHIADSAAPIREEGEEASGVVMVFRDVTDEYELHMQLKKSEEAYRTIFDAARDAMVFQDYHTGRILDVNQRALELYGFASKREMIGSSVEEHSSGEPGYTGKQAAEYLERAVAGEPQRFSWRARKKSGEFFWVEVQLKVVSIQDELKILAVAREAEPEAEQQAARRRDDADRSNRAEQALRESEERFRYILKHDPNAIAVYDKHLHYIIASDRYIKDYGIEGKEIIGKHHYEVFPEMPQRWKDIHQRVLRGEVLRNDNDSFEREDGSITYNRWECRPWYTIDGEIGGMITYTEVTTERVLAEQQKDLLMREIHHRVKNNLLMVSSLISLKEGTLGERVDLSDLSRQIDAIRFIHEKLMLSEDITRIQVKEYLTKLLDTLFSSDYRGVQVEQVIETEYLHSRTAMQLGLIINEVATNALKYGFRENEQPRFRVELREKRSDHEHELSISNSGNPFPEDIPIDTPKTLGLRLINALVAQLQGRLELQRRPSPVFTIRFPLESPGA